jgi:hypothetical protein
MLGHLSPLLLLVGFSLLFSGVVAGPPWLQPQPIQNVQLACVQLYCAAGSPFIVDQGQTQPIFLSVCQLLGIQYSSVQQVCLYVTTNTLLVNASYTPTLNPQNVFLQKQDYGTPPSGEEFVLRSLLLKETQRTSFQVSLSTDFNGARLSTVEMIRWMATPWPASPPVLAFTTNYYNTQWKAVFNQYFAGVLPLQSMCLQMAPIYFYVP